LLLDIASDYCHAYERSFLEIANTGRVSKLLLGMALYEGLSQKKIGCDLQVLNKN
jgi:hypothetical protein